MYIVGQRSTGYYPSIQSIVGRREGGSWSLEELVSPEPVHIRGATPGHPYVLGSSYDTSELLRRQNGVWLPVAGLGAEQGLTDAFPLSDGEVYVVGAAGNIMRGVCP